MTANKDLVTTEFGLLPANWHIVNLEDQLEYIIDYRGKTPKKSEEGIIALSAKSVKMGTIDYSKAYRISEDTYKKFMVRGFPQIGDVLLTTEAPLGCVARLDREGICVAQRLLTLRGKAGILDNDYLRYFLTSKIGQHELISRQTGSTVQGIKRSEFKKAKIILPDFYTQRKIAKILQDLDDKVEINNQINKTLEEMAQAIFKSWFVDFEPTKAKIKILEAGGSEDEAERAAMTAISGKDSGALDAMAADQPEAYAKLRATAKFFPAALTESDLGSIPEGWNIGSFTELAKLDTTSVQPKSNPNQVWDHYSIPAYDAAHYPVQDTGSSIKSGKYRVHELSVLVSKLNPQFKRIWWPKVSNPDTAICSTEFMQFVPLKQEDRGFVHGVISSEPFQENIRQSVTGSTGSRQRAQPPQVASSEIIIPSRDLINIYSSISIYYQTMIAENLDQNQALSNTRDTLLPKLMSGEIDLEGLADD